MECNGCTLCCKLLDIPNVSPIGEWCKHCDKEIGCKIHDEPNFPNDCKMFECAYYQTEKCNTKFRPDKCGVIFEKISENIFLGYLNEPEFSDIIKSQINSFKQQGFSVVMFHKKINPAIFPIENKTVKEIWEELQEKIRYGSTNI